MKRSLIAITVIFLLAAHQATAVALGVNKANIRFSDVLRNGYAETTLTATTDTSRNLTLDYEFQGDTAEWMRLEPINRPENTTRLTFSSSRPLRMRIIAEPPEDAANDLYRGKLQLLTGAFATIEGEIGEGVSAGSSVRASFGVKIQVDVTGDEIQSCTAGGFEIVDTEINTPLEFHGSIRNTGNVRVNPEFEVDIWNKQQTEIIRSVTLDPDTDILPTTQEGVVQMFDNELSQGQYWARITEPTCGDSGTITFNVLDIGEVSDRGELLRIDNQPWAETEDIIRIAAIFKNTGKRTVNAKFKGTIEKQGEVVEVIDTDTLQVRPGSTESLETFFNPTEPGRYEVIGRVIYNNKLTFEKSSKVNVQGNVAPRVTGNAVERILKNPYQIASIIIVFVIAGLLFLIRREKKKRRY